MLNLNDYFSAEAVDWMVFYVVRQESLSQALYGPLQERLMLVDCESSCNRGKETFIVLRRAKENNKMVFVS